MTEFTDEERADLAERDRRYRERRAAENPESSPELSATRAHERGDHIFQCVLTLLEQDARVVALQDAVTTQKALDANAKLNAICEVGWELVAADFVFVPTREQSREKLLRTGQDVAVAGSVLGYYVFRRVGGAGRPLERTGGGHAG